MDLNLESVDESERVFGPELIEAIDEVVEEKISTIVGGVIVSCSPDGILVRVGEQEVIVSHGHTVWDCGDYFRSQSWLTIDSQKLV